MFCFKRKGKQKIERKRIYLSHCSWARPSLLSPPPRPVLFFPSPFPRAAQLSSRPAAEQPDAAPLPFLLPLTSGSHVPRTPTRGAQMSEPSPTSCPGRTRARAVTAARDFARANLAAHVCPFKYSPRSSPSSLPNPRADRRLVLAEKAPPRSTPSSILRCVVFLLRARRPPFLRREHARAAPRLRFGPR